MTVPWANFKNVVNLSWEEIHSLGIITHYFLRKDCFSGTWQAEGELLEVD